MLNADSTLGRQADDMRREIGVRRFHLQGRDTDSPRHADSRVGKHVIQPDDLGTEGRQGQHMAEPIAVMIDGRRSRPAPVMP